MKILLGLMLAEERNCGIAVFLALFLLPVVLGLWVLPGADVMWRFVVVMQATARYRTGLMWGDAQGIGAIYGVSEERLDGVFENLKRAWAQAVSSGGHEKKGVTEDPT